jgi:CBS-domain-containing membrane protein
MREKALRDLAISLNRYPHMPYWGALKEAIVELIVSREAGHDSVLVFDEAYVLIGILSQAEILRTLAPKLDEKRGGKRSLSWDDLLGPDMSELLSRPIGDFMSPVSSTIDAQGGVLQAASIMLRENSSFLPVVENGKVIGILRLEDLFHEIINEVLRL